MGDLNSLSWLAREGYLLSYDEATQLQTQRWFWLITIDDPILPRGSLVTSGMQLILTFSLNISLT